MPSAGACHPAGSVSSERLSSRFRVAVLVVVDVTAALLAVAAPFAVVAEEVVDVLGTAATATSIGSIPSEG